MQKVYLLLRNNSQTGPFNLDELLQFELKPFDLIWIEGKSAGWYYPQEIEALKPYLSFVAKGEGLATVQSTPQVQPAQTSIAQPVATANANTYTQSSAPKKIYVSMPTAAVAEQKPEVKKEATPVNEAHQRYMPQPETKSVAYAPQFASTTTSSTVNDKSELKTAYNKSLDDAETDYMNWMYQKKTQKKPVFSKSGLIVLCLLGAGLFALGKWANRPRVEEAAAPQQTAAEVAPAAANADEPSTAKPALQKATGVGNPIKKEKTKKSSAETKNTATVVSKPLKNNPANVAVKMPIKNNGLDQPMPAAKEETGQAKVEEKSEPTASTEAPKEKKSLGEKIRDIFRKKSDEKKEEAKPVEEEEGKRQSTRRESGSSLAQLVKVSFEIPNSWMMGIKGAKATLSNRSSETLEKAVIEVRYYNDDNELLDKKNITFSNVKSKQSQTVSVPEHNTATRLEYSVISAVGNEAVAMLR